MKLMQVKTEDVYPDESNPRQSFEGIEELAESFDLNVERPGEPFIPPLLVRDGGIYRIVDGERRYKALCSRGAKQFWANVCDGMDEADSMAAMLATDDKTPLTDIERSRGAQRMLLLGVDPIKVEKAARFKGADKLAAVMAKADDAAEDLTLDRALAASEFLDDENAFNKLMTCSDKEWRYKVDEFRREKKRAEEKARYKEICEEHGITFLESYSFQDYDFKKSCWSAEELEKFIAETDIATDDLYVAIDYNSARVMTKAEEDTKKGSEEAEFEERAVQLQNIFKEVFAALRSFYWSQINLKHSKHNSELELLAFDRFKTEVLYEDCDEVLGFENFQPDAPSLMDLVIGYNVAFQWTELNISRVKGILKCQPWHGYDVSYMADLFRAAEADGFVFTEEMIPAKEAVEAYLESRADEDDEEAEGE